MSKSRAEMGFLQRLRPQWAWRRRALTRDESGATAVEFALLALPFFGIIAAIMQTAVVFLASQVLESAVNDAARTIRTGQFQMGGGDAASFRDAICDRLYGLFSDCDALHIRVVSMNQFQALNVVVPIDPDCETEEECEWSEPETFLPGTGEQVVLAQVFYRYPVIIQLGPFGMANLPDGTRLLGSSAVFKSEPWSG